MLFISEYCQIEKFHFDVRFRKVFQCNGHGAFNIMLFYQFPVQVPSNAKVKPLTMRVIVLKIKIKVLFILYHASYRS